MTLPVSNITLALEHLELTRISFYEVKACRNEIDPTQVSVVPVNDHDGNIEVEVAYRASDVGVDYRFKLCIRFISAEIFVDAAARPAN